MTQFLDFLNGWKTRLWAAFLAVAGVIVVLDPTWIIDIVGKENQGYVYIGIALITMVLRQFTTTPAGESEKFDG
jgi:hypothetical protein